MKSIIRNQKSEIERRRWESNPLEAALQATAQPSGSSVKQMRNAECGIRNEDCFQFRIPNSEFRIKKCPRQESNLIHDLRKVGCDPAHPKDISNAEFGMGNAE